MEPILTALLQIEVLFLVAGLLFVCQKRCLTSVLTSRCTTIRTPCGSCDRTPLRDETVAELARREPTPDEVFRAMRNHRPSAPPVTAGP